MKKTNSKSGLWHIVWPRYPLFLVSVFLLSFYCRAETLEKLEEIFQRGGGVRGFLEKPEIQEEYREALKRLYGIDDARLTKEVFQAFIAQLKTVIEKVPGAEARIEESMGDKEFSVISNRSLSLPAWKNYIANFIDKLRQNASLLSQGQLRTLNDVFYSIANEVEAFEVSNSRLSNKRQRRIEAAQFYSELKKRPLVIAAVSAALLHKLESPIIKDRLEAGSLQVFDELREAVAEWAHFPSTVLKDIANSYLPDKKALEADTSFFPSNNDLILYPSISDEKLLVGEIRFVPFPRRFHGIWKGIFNGECLGGCSHNLGSLTPERWGTVLLQNTELYAVFHGKKFEGWLQLVPIRQIDGDELYASVDFGSSLLQKRIALKSPDGKTRAVSMVDAWLESYFRRKSLTKGVVIGKSNDINNSGVLFFARDSISHRFGMAIGPHTKFDHFDKTMATAIVAVSPSDSPSGTNHIRSYTSRNMIFDAATKDPGELILLQPQAFDILDSGDKIRAILRKRKTHEFLAHLIQIAPNTPGVKEIIVQEWNDLSKSLRPFVVNWIAYHVSNGILRPSDLLFELVVPNIKAFLSLFEKSTYGTQLGISTSLVHSLKIFQKYNPSPKHWATILKKYTIDSHLNIILTSAFKSTRSAKGYLEMFRKIRRVFNGKEKDLDNAVIETLNHYFGFNPSVAEIYQLERMLFTVGARIRVKKVLLPETKRAEDFLGVLDYKVMFPSKASKVFIQETQNLLKENWDHFLSLNPTVPQILSGLRFSNSIELNMHLRIKTIEHLKTPSDFIEFFKNEHRSNATEDYKKNVWNLLWENRERFFRLNRYPSVNEVIALCRICGRIDTSIYLLKTAMQLQIPKHREEGERLFRMQFWLPTHAYQIALLELRRAYESELLALPKKGESRLVLKSTVWICSKILSSFRKRKQDNDGPP